VAGLLLVNRRQRNLLFALAAVLSVSLKAWAALRWFPEGIDSDTYFRTVYSHFPFRLDGFIAGMFAAFLWRDEGTRRSLGRPLVATGLFWSGAGLLVSWAGLSTPVDFHVGLFSEVFQMSLLALAFGAMMLGLLGGSFGHKVFMSRPLRFIGLVSYSLYLTHGAVLRPSINTVLRVVPMNHPMLAWLLSLIPILFFGMCLSTVSYYVIEKPCIAWSRKSKAQSMTF
jgi:peptidoglycan/LPS O-acetylase OafA/YrhL